MARGVFTLGAGRGAWDAAVDALVKSDFARLGRAVDDEGLRALEPLADVYLERAIRDYPAAGAAIADQWSALQDVLTGERDASALFDVGSSYNALRSGLDSAVPYDLRSARQRAEQCFREVLKLLPADDPDRPGAQNNLGVALADQAGPATGKEQRRLLGEAVAAYRQALTVRTREHDPNGWASTQFNIALLLVDSANLALPQGDSGQACAELREALRAINGAEEVFRQGSPTYLGYAVELRRRIEARLAELGCPPE